MTEPSAFEVLKMVVACLIGAGVGVLMVGTAVRMFGSPPTPPPRPTCTEPGYVYLSRDRVCVQGYRAFPR